TVLRIDFLIIDQPPEADLIGAFAAVEFPGIAVLEPGFGQFGLPATDNLLTEKTVAIADAVAIGGDADRRHAFHEAGGKPAKPAISERRIGLERRDHVEIHPELRQRLAHSLHQFEVRDRIAQKPPDQELEAEVIDPFCLGGIGRRSEETRLNSSHVKISYAVFCLKKKNK